MTDEAEIRSPKSEGRKKSEGRSPKPSRRGPAFAEFRSRTSGFGLLSAFGFRISGLFLLLAGTCSTSADSLELTPAADTTLAEVSPGNNFGGTDFFNAGTAGNHRPSRGLLRFDLSGLPAGAVLNSAELVFDVIRQPQDGLEPSSFELHRALVSWGEGFGVSDPGHPGRGAPALPGEATWLARFFGTGLTWSQPGGAFGVDFAAESSGELTIIGLNDSPYTLAGTPALLADLDYWRANPAANFGWFWLSGSEGVPYTARSFSSREGVSPPMLRVEYNVPEPATFSLLALGCAALAMRRRV